MARLKPAGKTGLFARLVKWIAARRLGVVPEPLAIQSSHPAVLFGVAMMETGQERAHLVPPKLKALAGLRAATRIGCPW
jgi:hypothetical protein